jgi:serine/threonine protein kinase
MEYMRLGNLAEQSGITESEVVTFVSQVLDALEYLHSRTIVHRDLKPKNILVRDREPLYVKIADFGLAQSESVLRTYCGTQLYCAPEIGSGHYTDKVDIWSLGVIAYQYVYGLPEFPEAQGDWYQTLVDQVLDWESDELVDFLSSSMLKIDPGERLPARECRDKLEPMRQATEARKKECLELDVRSPTEPMSSASVLRYAWAARHGMPRAAVEETEEQFEESNSQEHIVSGTSKRRRIEKCSKEMPLDQRSRHQDSQANCISNSNTPNGKPACDQPVSFITEWGDDSFLRPLRRSRLPTPTYVHVKSSHSDQHAKNSSPVDSRPRSAAQLPQHHDEDPAPLSCGNPTEPFSYQPFQETSQLEGLSFDTASKTVKVVINQQAVSMRTSNFFVSATSIMNLADVSKSDRAEYMKEIKRHSTFEVTYRNTWITFTDAYLLCNFLRVMELVQPLFEYGRRHGAVEEEQPNYLEKKFPGHFSDPANSEEHCLVREFFEVSTSYGSLYLLLQGSQLLIAMPSLMKLYGYKERPVGLPQSAIKVYALEGRTYLQGYYDSLQSAYHACRLMDDRKHCSKASTLKQELQQIDQDRSGLQPIARWFRFTRPSCVRCNSQEVECDRRVPCDFCSQFKTGTVIVQTFYIRTNGTRLFVQYTGKVATNMAGGRLGKGKARLREIHILWQYCAGPNENVSRHIGTFLTTFDHFKSVLCICGAAS